MDSAVEGWTECGGCGGGGMGVVVMVVVLKERQGG